jgi:ATP-binding cassette, subfamily B (MDR/TAP), member 1
MRLRKASGGQPLPTDAEDKDDSEKGVKLEFQNVWFRYPTRDAPVLNGLNMVVGTPDMTLNTAKQTCI